MRRFFLGIFGLLLVSNVASCLALENVLGRLRAPSLLGWFVAAFVIFQGLGLLAVIGGRLLGIQPGTGMGRPLLSLFLIWNLLLAFPTAVGSLIWAGVWAMMDGRSEVGSTARDVGLVLAVLPMVAALLATVVAAGQLGCFRIRKFRLAIPSLPEALRGFTIVHLSDLHIGKLTRGRVLEAMVTATNKLEADVILFTGDLVNMALEDLPEGFDLLQRMKARHGLFLCEGNHDLIESRAGFETAAKASGLTFLLNESATFSVKGQGVQILGLRWGEGTEGGRETGGPVSESALQRLLAKRQAGDFTILLVHHPEAFDDAAAAGIPLTLAGHTHGGQLMLTPTFGFGPWLYRYWSGLYRKGSSQLVVSNGAGNWFPLRIGAPAEIIHLTLE